MKDIQWDFVNNDVAIVDTSTGGDFVIANMCSQQNAMLIFTKSAVSIFNPQFGAAMEERVYNLSDAGVQKIIDKAKSQIREDGAVQVSIKHQRDENGLYEFEVGAKYAGE